MGSSAGLQARIADYYGPLIAVYREKGLQTLVKPGALAVAALLMVYSFVLQSTRQKVLQRQRELAAAKANAEFAETYEVLKARLTRARTRLPLWKDKDSWLYDAILQSAKQYGVTLNSISSQKEHPLGQFVLVQYSVSASIPYQQMGEWIAGMESSKTMMRVTQVDIDKDPLTRGSNKVSLEISTLLLKAASP